MKRIAAISALAILALTGCTPEAKESPKLEPTVHQNLTPEESSQLDAAATVVKFRNKEIAISSVTDTTSENGKKHVRFAIDTSKFAAPCPTPAKSEDDDKACLRTVHLASGKKLTGSTFTSDGADIAPLTQGRSVIEFDADETETLSINTRLANGESTGFHVRTGKLFMSGLSNADSINTATLTPGLNEADTQKLQSTTPQYKTDQSSVRVAPGTLTTTPEGRTVISTPVELKLSETPCPDSGAVTGEDCYRVLVTTVLHGGSPERTPDNIARESSTGGMFTAPADFTGVLTLDTTEVTTGKIEISTMTKDRMFTRTEIDLMTGETSQSTPIKIGPEKK